MFERKITRREWFKLSAQIAAGLMAMSAFPRKLHADGDRYDFIIVGSGAGGGPLSANLARAGYRVLLMEAGADSSDLNYFVPAFHGLSTEDPLYSWNFYVKHYSNPTYAAQDTKYVPDKGILYPRAATLGGCTAHNAMITMYPDNSDWDNIAELTCDSSWHSGVMRQYYTRVLDWLNTEQNPIDLLLRDNQLTQIVLGAFQELGTVKQLLGQLVSEVVRGHLTQLLSLNPNDATYVNSRAEGLFLTPKATHNGVRNGARERVNAIRAKFPDRLVVKTNALASRVLFKDGTTQAVGVEFVEGASVYAADPRATYNSQLAGIKKSVMLAPGGEVILAGGAFNSPQLLMLSGIGAPDALGALGIKPRVSLPGVGKNLQDRYEVSVVNRMRHPFALLSGCTFNQGNDPCLSSYQRDSMNTPYGSNGVVLGIKKRSGSDQLDPDLFIFGLPAYFRGYYPGWSKDFSTPGYFTWSVLKGHTVNRAGEVNLRSANPLDTPDINFKYFEEGSDTQGRDLDAVVTGLKLARRLSGNSQFRSLGRREAIPGVKQHSVNQLKEFARQEAWGHHASCSNKMGKAGDPMAVVSSDFKVYGTQSLRVVDASVFPRIPGLFIALPIYMISEKASQVILAEKSKQGKSPA